MVLPTPALRTARLRLSPMMRATAGTGLRGRVGGARLVANQLALQATQDRV